MGWLIFLAILVLLGCMPLGLRLRYDAGGAEAVLLVGMFRLRLYPMSERLHRLLHRPLLRHGALGLDGLPGIDRLLRRGRTRLGDVIVLRFLVE